MLNRTLQVYQQNAQIVQQGYIKDRMEQARARMEGYIKAREYDGGVHQTQLTDRSRQYLNVTRDTDFNVNYCSMVNNAKADRLKVIGFDSDDIQKEILQQWWRKNRMDRKQGIVHRASIRDGDAFVLVEWDADANIPRFHFEPAYAGDGTMVYYSDERRDEIEFASKYWRISRGAGAGQTRRCNLYFPDRVEKYISKDYAEMGNWKPFEDENTVLMAGHLGMAGVVWWTDNGAENGLPLGVPVVHFKHNDTGDRYGTSHLASVMPIQDALNKTMIDLLAASDANGFPLFVGYGTTDWAGTKVGPGAIAAVAQSPDKAKLERLPADNPQGLLSVYNALVMEIARVSGTPLSYFQTSGQVAAEGTMKQQEIALVSQVQKAQTDFGNAWEDCFILARRLHNAFSSDPELDTDVLIDTVWEQAESRNDKEQAETLALKVEKLGVSEEQAQVEMGYDATQRAAFARAKLRRQAQATRRMLTLPATTTDEDENLTQTENEDEPAREAAA